MKPLTPYQRGLQFFNGVLFVPNGVDGAGRGLGAAWTTGAAATITHPVPGTAVDTQFKRTVYANAAVTNNQELGPRLSGASDYQFWLGGGVDLGGFYFSAIFRIVTWSADTGRLFVGLTGNAAAICVSDTIPANTFGLWHDSTDGQDVLSFVHRNNVTAAAKESVTTHALNSGILATGVTLLFEIWQYPFGDGKTNTSYKLSYFNTSNNRLTKVKYGASGIGSSSTATMLAPQVQMSNGADGVFSIIAGDFSIGVANVYCAPYSGEIL